MRRVKLDENLSRAHVEFLRERGYDADRVHDEGLSGESDERVWQEVVREGRFFITLDLDFSDVRKFPPGEHPGILLIRAGTSRNRPRHPAPGGRGTAAHFPLREPVRGG